MGISLTGLTPATTYDALIKVGDNGPIGATLKTLSDGLGNDLPMQASTTGINFTGTVSGLASGVSGAIQFTNGSAFASDASNLFWDNTNKRLNIGQNTGSRAVNINDSLALYQSGTTTLQVAFHAESYGGRFASFGASQFVIPNSYNGVYSPTMNIGSMSSTTNLGATVGIKGSGSTSATTSLLVQNSAGSTNLIVTDDQVIKGYAGTQLRFQLGGSSQAGISTRNGALCIGYIDGNFQNGLQIAAQGSGKTFIDGWNDGGSSQFDIVIGNQGSRTQFGTDSASVSSAQVTINSTTKGFLPPRMTTTQKNAIATPAAGLVVYDTTMNATCEYTGTAWRVVSAGAQALAAPTNATTVDLSAGNVLSISLTSSTTFTFTGASVGTYILKLIQGGSGSYTVTWPGTVIWSGGTAPTLTTTVSKLDIITLVYDGTNYYGNYSLNY